MKPASNVPFRLSTLAAQFACTAAPFIHLYIYLFKEEAQLSLLCDCNLQLWPPVTALFCFLPPPVLMCSSESLLCHVFPPLCTCTVLSS